MEFLMKVGYYGVSAMGVLGFGLFFLGNLVSSSAGDNWVTKLILLVSGLVGLAIFGWSVMLGHFGGNWGTGILMAAGSLLLFFILMVAGTFMFTTVNWQ